MSATVISPVLVSRPSARTAPPAKGRWVNVLSHLDPKYGGMSAAVPALSSAVYSTGQHAVSLAGFCAAGENYSPFSTQEVPVHHLPAGHSNWLKDKSTRTSFTRLIEAASGVHIHGLWEHSTLVAARAARKADKPYILSAHGMLQAWALNNKRLKKAVYGAFIERSNLRHAACLHALTQAEVKDYRDYGLTNPVAVIPNGVEIPKNIDPQIFLATFPELRNKRLVLFLSRLHTKKGVDILCQAWASAAKRWPDAQLVLAGPDFENTRASIEAAIASSGMQERVTITGMLDSGLKWSALSAADCFVLPSYSEGLSVSVLEAMGMRLPVIITRQCNLPEVASKGCGWVIEPTAGALESALNDCLCASSSALAEMSSRGQRLVDRDYSWRVVGEQMSEIYTWLEGGSVPSNVEIDFGGRS